MKKIAVFAFATAFAANVIVGQSAADRGFAEEEFRIGVQSFYAGAFREAAVQFEKALSFVPNEAVFLEWLGRAYYRSGLESAAIDSWKAAADGRNSLLLDRKIELVQTRQLIPDDSFPSARFVESGSFFGSDGETLFFANPSSVLPLSDGTFWICAFGSNEIIHLNQNGTIIARSRGPVNGFDRPMDILRRRDGGLLVSEFAGDRIAVLDDDGGFLRHIGKSGFKDGELLGPQFMAQDENGNVFVTDFGNSRVSVFAENGDFLFNFGGKSEFFDGFAAPSGIAVVEGLVYVADSVRGTIYLFDKSGNFIEKLLPDGVLKRPESLREWNGDLVVADLNRICLFSIADSDVREIAKLGNGAARFTAASSDANDSLLAADFQSSEICSLARMDKFVYGFDVQIECVNADNFPDVLVDLRVSDKDRTPVVGLDSSNFLISEGRSIVAEQSLEFAASKSEHCEISLVLDRSFAAAAHSDAMRDAVREIAAAVGGDRIHVVCAGKIPEAERDSTGDGLGDFDISQLKSEYSDEVQLDLALRMAASRLANGERKRAVVLLTAGGTNQSQFERNGAAELAALMNNNGVRFSVVNFGGDAISEEVEYISRRTGGWLYSANRLEGLAAVVGDLKSAPNGAYRLKYRSSLQTDFGRKFLPLEVECHLLNRSGRDEISFYAPME